MEMERHFTIKEIATAWNLSVDTVRELFTSEAGVLAIRRDRKKSKRAYTTLRVPELVFNRVKARIVVKPTT